MKKLAYLFIGVFLLCSCSGETNAASMTSANLPISFEEQQIEMVEKSSKVVRIKCRQQIFGNNVASFIFAILLEDGKSFTFSVRFVDDKKFYKDLFLVEVGDTIVYSGNEIVEIKFAI